MTTDQLGHEWRKFKNDMENRIPILDEEFENMIYDEFQKITELHRLDQKILDYAATAGPFISRLIKDIVKDLTGKTNLYYEIFEKDKLPGVSPVNEMIKGKNKDLLMHWLRRKEMSVRGNDS